MQEAVEGLADAYAMFGRLPEAAREELAVELGIIAREIRDLQRRMVPKDTGHLEGGLAIAVDVERLRERIGLLGLAYGKTLGSYYYGRFVALGRHAQTVLVTRRIKNRTLGGNNRNGNKRRAMLGGKAYPMKVRAMAGRDFIHVPEAEELALGQLREFWSRTLKRAGVQ